MFPSLLTTSGGLGHHGRHVVVTHPPLVRGTDALRVVRTRRERHDIPRNPLDDGGLNLAPRCAALRGEHDTGTEFPQRVGVLEVQRGQHQRERRRAVRPRQHPYHVRPERVRRGGAVDGVAQQPSIVGDRIPLRDAVLGYAQFAKFRPEEGEVARLQQLRAPHERRARLRRLDPLGHEAAQRHEVGVREAQQRQEDGEGGDLDAGAPLEVGEELVQLDEGAVRVEAVSDVGGL